MINFVSNKYLLLLFRLFVGFIFIYAGIEKISDPSAFSTAIYNYKLLPISLVNFLAITLPWIELTAGLLLLFGVYVKENSSIISILLVIFFIAIAISLARGLNIECGCFGTSSGSKIGLIKLGENLVLILMSSILIKFGSELFSLKENGNN